MANAHKMYVKVVEMPKAELEVELQEISAKYNFSPKILNVIKNKRNWRIVMEDLDELSLADKYGDDPSEIPLWIWAEIRTMLTTLLNEEGIEYVDITPYNFIEKDNRIYIIDFGDARYTHGMGLTDWFLNEFLEGENSWNPDYK